MNHHTLLHSHTRHFTISFIESAMRYFRIILACTLFSYLPLKAMDKSVEKMTIVQRVEKRYAEIWNANKSLPYACQNWKLGRRKKEHQ